MELRNRGGSQRVQRELMSFQFALPGFNKLQDNGNIQMFVKGGIFLEIGPGEFEQGGRGSQAVFLEVDECAGKLDEALIKCVFGAMPVREPELLEDFVGFKVKTAVEAFKKAEVMSIQILPAKGFDEGGDFGVLIGHINSVIEMANIWQQL